MKKMKRLAVMTACAALAGSVSVSAACLPQQSAANTQASPASLSALADCLQNGSCTSAQTIRQTLNQVCKTADCTQTNGNLPANVRQALDNLCNTANCTDDSNLPATVRQALDKLYGNKAEAGSGQESSETPSAQATEDNSADTSDTQNTETPVETDTASQTPAETETSTAVSQYAAEVVRLVNVEREKAGLSDLTINDKAQAAAQIRAGELQQSFSHTRPNGTTPFTALTEAGASYQTAGENIAMGQKTPAEVVNAWMNSAGHRANILNDQFTSIGVGYTTDANGTAYWSQLFIG